MSRSCYALSVLLITFAGSMLVLQAAHGQMLLDARRGPTAHRVCPLLGDHMYDCGYGPLATPLGLGTIPRGCALTETLGPIRLGMFDCALGTTALGTTTLGTTTLAASQEAEASTGPAPQQLLSGHDPLYDTVVYGSGESNNPTTAVAETAAAPRGFVFFLPDPPEPVAAADERSEPTVVAEICQQEVFENLWFDACWPVPSAPQAATVARAPLEVEPESLDEYYAMYGGDPAAHAPAALRLRAGAASELLSLPGRLVEAVWNNEFVASRWCEWQGLSYRLRHRGYAAVQRVADDYRVWVVSFRPAVTHLAAPLAAPQCPLAPAAAEAAAAPAAQPDAERLGRLMLKSLARKLDQTGRLLQNASRELDSLLENETAEVNLWDERID